MGNELYQVGNEVFVSTSFASVFLSARLALILLLLEIRNFKCLVGLNELTQNMIQPRWLQNRYEPHER